MNQKIGIIIDPLDSLHPEKDSSLAMIWEAMNRGYDVIAFYPENIFVKNGVPSATGILLKKNLKSLIKISERSLWEGSLKELDLLFMRKDPPFDMEYIYLTYFMDALENLGVRCINPGSSLRNVNEKYYISNFPNCIPPTLISSSVEQINKFIAQYKKVVLKPLDGMGGKSIFVINKDDPNRNVILETLLGNKRTIMAQKYLPEIKNGDKRILIINGNPIDFMLKRIPSKDDFRGNLVRGAKAKIVRIGNEERRLCEKIRPHIIKNQLMFVGLDVIGNFITEINVTSPTGIREIEKAKNINITKILFDEIESS